MKVSACLIVKDEESTLPTCLNSLAGAVDELIIVDTGSSDRTVEVARQYSTRVFEFPWCDDFSAARQFSFDQATGSWVFWADADDIIIGAGQIRALAANAPADLSGYFVRYAVEGGDFWRERLVRAGAFRWAGRCHEVLEPVISGRLERTDEVLVQHMSPPERRPAKIRRNVALLEKELAESGDQPSERTLYYLGRELVIAGECDRALDILSRFVEVATWDEERYTALTLIAGLHRQHGDFDAAIETDLRALYDCPHWPFAYFGLAETAYRQQDWSKVVHWCDLGRTRPRPETLQIFDDGEACFNWIIFYVSALSQLGRVAEALSWTVHALALRPDDEEHRANLRHFADGILATPAGN